MHTRALRITFIIVDVGFVAYWVFAAMSLFPQDWLFKDYDNPILQAWNFSFLPLDLLVSATGFAALICERRGLEIWRQLALLSLSLTFASGLQAVSFWALRSDFDLAWWAPNLFLMAYPLVFIGPLMRRQS